MTALCTLHTVNFWISFKETKHIYCQLCYCRHYHIQYVSIHCIGLFTSWNHTVRLPEFIRCSIMLFYFLNAGISICHGDRNKGFNVRTILGYRSTYAQWSGNNIFSISSPKYVTAFSMRVNWLNYLDYLGSDKVQFSFYGYYTKT